jgi:cysteine dioxygenase
MNIIELEHIISEVLNTSPDFESKREKMIEKLKPLELEKHDWSKYFFFENSSYTRNAVIHNDLFSVLIICWDKCSGSPIHNHPSEGCWIVGLEGTIEEKRYLQLKDGKLKEAESSIIKSGEISWMHDSIGYHKVGNFSNHSRGVTLHIYSPPYKMCKVIKENGDYWYCAPKYYSINNVKVDM